MQNCGRRLSQNYSKNALTYVTEDMEEHLFVCPASRCTYGFTGHVTKAYISDSNQIMVVYWSVYSDFLPTLCVCVCVYIYIYIYMCVCVCINTHTQTHNHHVILQPTKITLTKVAYFSKSITRHNFSILN